MNATYPINEVWGGPYDDIERSLIENGGIENLAEWIQQTWSRLKQKQDIHSQSDKIRGRMYTASTIKYNKSGFVQTGSSPNCFGGLWTLTCCKRDMRSPNKTNDEAIPDYFIEDSDGHYKPTHPVLIYSASEKSDYGAEYDHFIATIAMVTDGFFSMKKYGEYLFNHYDGAPLQNRITTHEDPSHIGSQKGDCHVKITNKGVIEAEPSPNHDHHKSNPPCGHDQEYEEDLDSSHLKLVSKPGFWISFEQPLFKSGSNYRANGKKIHSFTTLKQEMREVNL